MVGVETPRKEHIHRVAAKLFRERGYHATAMRDIADAVGIQGGSLYTHVHSKDDMLWQMVSRSSDRFFAALTPIVDSDRGVLQRLRDAIIAHIKVITTDLDVAAVFSTEWKHLSDERRDAIAQRRDQYETLFRGMIRQGIAQRLLAGPDEGLAALFLLSSLNWVYHWYRPDGRLSPDELGGLIADYVFDGLRRRAS